MSAGALGSQEALLMLVQKIPAQTWKDIRSDRIWRTQCDTFENLAQLLRTKAKEDHLERFLFNQQRKEKLNVVQTVDVPMSSAHPDVPSSADRHGNWRGRGKGKGRSKSVEKGKGHANRPAPSEPCFRAKVECKFCGRTGHYENKCWQKQKEERKKKREESASNRKQDALDQSENSKKRKVEKISYMSNAKTLFLECKVMGRLVNSVIDTGATISAISAKFTDGCDIR